MQDFLTFVVAVGLLLLPLLLIWRMMRVQRRVRAQMARQEGRIEDAYVDGVASSDGLTTGLAFQHDPALSAADRSSTGIDDVKNLEGRR